MENENNENNGNQSSPISSSTSSSEIKSQESAVVPMLPERNRPQNNSSSDTVAMKPISTRIGVSPKIQSQNKKMAAKSECCLLI